MLLCLKLPQSLKGILLLGAEFGSSHVLVGGVEVLIQGLLWIVVVGRRRLELIHTEPLILRESIKLSAEHLRVYGLYTS